MVTNFVIVQLSGLVCKFPPEGCPTHLFHLLLTAELSWYAALSEVIHQDSPTVHFLCYLFYSFFHPVLTRLSLFSFNRRKRVFVCTRLPAEPALHEYGGELRMPETDQLPPGIPDPQWHLRRYGALYRHQSSCRPQRVCCTYKRCKHARSQWEESTLFSHTIMPAITESRCYKYDYVLNIFRTSVSM